MKKQIEIIIGSFLITFGIIELTIGSVLTFFGFFHPGILLLSIGIISFCIVIIMKKIVLMSKEKENDTKK